MSDNLLDYTDTKRNEKLSQYNFIRSNYKTDYITEQPTDYNTDYRTDCNVTPAMRRWHISNGLIFSTIDFTKPACEI